MDTKPFAGATERNVATASQDAYSLQNNASFTSLDNAKLSAFDSNKTVTATEDTLSTMPQWQQYIADMGRFATKEKPVFNQIERMTTVDPRYKPIMQKYGRDFVQFQNFITDYNDMSKVPFWDRMRVGTKAAWYSLRVNDRMNKVEQLKHDGADEADIIKAQEELQKAQFDYENNSQEFQSDTINVLAQIGASTVRILPEMIATTVAASLASSITGGASLAAGGARIARLLDVYKNTGSIQNLSKH